MIATVVIVASLAGSAMAEEAPRQYQSDTAIKIAADAGKSTTVRSDALDQVSKIGLQATFTCAQANCGQAGFAMALAGGEADTASLAFDGQNSALLGRVARGDGGGNQSIAGAPKPGETFDVRIHWTGNRVSFDLYRKDATTGAQLMESHEVQMDGPVKTLVMTASGGTLEILSQTYTFR